MSRVGKKPINIPSGVKVSITGGSVSVEGPKGKLRINLHPAIKVEEKDSNIIVKRSADTKIDMSLHGLMRSLINNMIEGVTNGYSKELEITGVGYKGQVSGKTLRLELGFSHPVNFAIPEGTTIETPKPNRIKVSGIDKQLVGKVASEIRALRKPEPYKGKGIRYAGEHIRQKAGKAAVAGGAPGTGGAK